MATAHALLARAELPVVPALLSLAVRAAANTLPDVAQTVQVLERMRAQQPQAQPLASSPSPAASEPQPVTSDQRPAASDQRPVTSSPSPGTSDQRPLVNSPRPATSDQRTVASSQQPIASRQQPGAILQPRVPSHQPATPQSPAASFQPPASSLQPVTVQPPAFALPDLARQGPNGVMQALHLAGIRPATPLPNAAPLLFSTPQGPVLVERLAVVIGLSIPDAPDAALPAPAPAPSPAAVPAAQPRALATPTAQPPLADAPRPLPPEAPREATQSSPAPAPPPEIEAATIRVAREQLAEQVFKPKDLADYDRVVPLPLMAEQVPTPARLAVATRSTAGGQEATFVRVDAELSRLGPVSIRLSGPAAGGPIAITLVAEGAAGPALAEHLPQLVDDLRKLGLDAAVRVVGDA
jgi:hypothetical protein